MVRLLDFPLTDRTKLCVGFDEYKGKEFFNIRQFAKNAAGEWVATPKGVSLPDIDRKRLAELEEFFASSFKELKAVSSGKGKGQSFLAKARTPSGRVLKTASYSDFERLMLDLDTLGWRAFFNSNKVTREEYEPFGFTGQRDLAREVKYHLFLQEREGSDSRTTRIIVRGATWAKLKAAS